MTDLLNSNSNSNSNSKISNNQFTNKINDPLIKDSTETTIKSESYFSTFLTSIDATNESMNLHDKESDSIIYFHPKLQKPVCHINFFNECDRYANIYKNCMSDWYKQTPEVTIATHCVKEWVNLERCMILQARFGTLDVILDEDMVSQIEDISTVESLLDPDMKSDPYIITNNKFFKVKYGYSYLPDDIEKL